MEAAPAELAREAVIRLERVVGTPLLQVIASGAESFGVIGAIAGG